MPSEMKLQNDLRVVVKDRRQLPGGSLGGVININRGYTVVSPNYPNPGQLLYVPYNTTATDIMNGARQQLIGPSVAFGQAVCPDYNAQKIFVPDGAYSVSGDSIPRGAVYMFSFQP